MVISSIWFCLVPWSNLAARPPELEDTAEVNKIRIQFAATNKELAMYHAGAKVKLKSAVASDSEKTVQLIFSNMDQVDCENANEKKEESNIDFVLFVFLGKNGTSLSHGKIEKPGVMFTTIAGPYFNTSADGFVTVEKVGDMISGTLAIDDKKLKLDGRFSAAKCK